jgi:hypothetical protein
MSLSKNVESMTFPKSKIEVGYRWNDGNEYFNEQYKDEVINALLNTVPDDCKVGDPKLANWRMGEKYGANIEVYYVFINPTHEAIFDLVGKTRFPTEAPHVMFHGCSLESAEKIVANGNFSLLFMTREAWGRGLYGSKLSVSIGYGTWIFLIWYWLGKMGVGKSGLMASELKPPCDTGTNTSGTYRVIDCLNKTKTRGVFKVAICTKFLTVANASRFPSLCGDIDRDIGRWLRAE